MSRHIIAACRAEAKQRRIPWSAVRAAYEAVKAAEREKREHPNTVRQTAWYLITAYSPGCWPFWRHGFLARWGHKLAHGHDYTIVPGYDDLAQEVAAIHPEFATDDGTERLFDFLFSTYDPLPPAEQLYRKALDLSQSWCPSRCDDSIPF